MTYCNLCGDYGGHTERGECPALDDPEPTQRERKHGWARHVWKLDDRGEPEMFELGSNEDMDDGHYCIVCEEYYSRFSADHHAQCPGRPTSMHEGT